jgi:hypothetical protein
MVKEKTINHKIVLEARPQGEPKPENFRLVEEAIPSPAEGELLLRTLYLSLDPYMRGRMSEGPSYAPPVALGDVMVGGTVSRIIRSRHPRFQEGELVAGYTGWQEYALSSGDGLTSIGHPEHPSYYLGVLGMTGFTAYAGLLKIGDPKPGETVVVAAASGAVGSVVGQIAKLKGAHVVGIAGGTEKCDFVVKTLGFDNCIDHHAADFATQLVAACPRGIDVYFESVGGKVFEAVFPLLNVGARVPLCGMIARYNDNEPPAGPNQLPSFLREVLTRRLKFQGFIIGDFFKSTFEEFRAQMTEWVSHGQIKVREDFVAGLTNAPQAFIGLLHGKNFGKLIVRVSE